MASFSRLLIMQVDSIHLDFGRCYGSTREGKRKRRTFRQLILITMWTLKEYGILTFFRHERQYNKI